ncbi:Rne/Rng family ribonuclease [Candidatus Babeliales bacterium]|nr:Rne/Rng family ribonuclease [Candidatus Babeliales bacterium]
MKKILINSEPWQTRVAITRNGNILQNIYFEPHAHDSLERAFFKGHVATVLPGIQTAFVDIGQEKAGFLHISEIDRELAIEKMGLLRDSEIISSGQDTERRERSRIDISKILREGEPILVQVSKEPIYEKGAKLTTCFTLPGRFIVLMPNIPRIGISKKIESREERARLKEILMRRLPTGMGAIVRTSSEGAKEQDIEQDIAFLVRTWRSIDKKFRRADMREKIYEDLDLALATVRDNLDDDVEEIIVDEPQLQKRIYRFVKNIAPEHAQKVKLYTGEQSLFMHYDIDRQIDSALEKKVLLRSGGSIVIETTEAMTVVDVNTGRFTGKSNLEDTILKTNLEAAEEVARQLRLRNIGGLIVIDFIDMATATNRQRVFKFFEKTLKERDKFQSVVLKISEFGLVQMTRKRSGKQLRQQLTEDCICCGGNGFLPSVRSEAFRILEQFEEALHQSKKSGDTTLRVSPEVFEYLSTYEYNTLLTFEKQFQRKIVLQSNTMLDLNQFEFIG